MIVCRLEEILKERGLKKNWFADQVGVSQATISKWLKHGVIPELQVAYRVAEVLDLNVMEIWVRV